VLDRTLRNIDVPTVILHGNADQIVPFAVLSRQDVLLGAYPNAAAFRALDEEFYQYPDNLVALVTKYKSSV
jgi:pimeloyl-ACP methyl ester carboxylesterase